MLFTEFTNERPSHAPKLLSLGHLPYLRRKPGQPNRTGPRNRFRGPRCSEVVRAGRAPCSIFPATSADPPIGRLCRSGRCQSFRLRMDIFKLWPRVSVKLKKNIKNKKPHKNMRPAVSRTDADMSHFCTSESVRFFARMARCANRESKRGFSAECYHEVHAQFQEFSAMCWNRDVDGSAAKNRNPKRH